MDFALTEAQQLFKKMMRDFATRELEPLAAHIDETEEFPAESMRKLAALGVLGLGLPEEYGGSGGDSIQTCIAVEEMARACVATSTIVATSLSLCSGMIFRYGSDDQKRRYLPALVRGARLGAFGLTEPGAGSDVAAIKTTAQRRGDRYVINGSKQFITNGAEADILVLFATVDRSLGYKGITSFIVEKEMPGFAVGKKERKLGIRASSTAELVFSDCAVPAKNVLGEEGEGFRQAIETIDASRVVIAAQAVGVAQAAFEASLKYAQERVQFGQPIASFQAIQFMLADMATQVEAGRLMTYQAAWLKDHGQPFVKQACMAKLFTSEVAEAVTSKAIQVHGGYGYIKDYPVERYFRDAKITEIYEGTSEMQRWTIARNLLKGL